MEWQCVIYSFLQKLEHIFIHVFWLVGILHTKYNHMMTNLAMAIIVVEFHFQYIIISVYSVASAVYPYLGSWSLSADLLHADYVYLLRMVLNCLTAHFSILLISFVSYAFYASVSCDKTVQMLLLSICLFRLVIPGFGTMASCKKCI